MRCVLLLITLCASLPVAFSQMIAPLAIDAQGRVTFTVDAPTATSVQVVGKGNGNGLGTTPIDLAKVSASEWRVTTDSIRPGFHYYDILIDGVATTDLKNHVYFGWGRWASGLEVSDPSNDFYEPKPGVARGEVRFVYYDSEITGRTRKCLVYVPDEYDKNPERNYPVLYLQHGNGESELGWLNQGKVNFIMDNLIHEGRAEPMLVVMDNGFAASPGATNWYRPSFSQNVFDRLVVEELVPLIDARFRTDASSNRRAIAGLSMGGQQAGNIVFKNPNTFQYLGMFSAGLNSVGTLTNAIAARLNDKMRLIWMGTGLQDEFLNNYIRVAHNAFEQKNVVHQYEEIDGIHEWQVWRKCLNRFAPKLFKPAISNETIGMSISSTPHAKGAALLEIQYSTSNDRVLEQSSDLSTWTAADLVEAEAEQSVGIWVSNEDQQSVFLRLVEAPWE